MQIADHYRNHEECLRQAAEWLGVPVRAVDVMWGLEHLLKKHARREERRGFVSENPVLHFWMGPRGQGLAYGMERYRIDLEGHMVGLVKVVAPACGKGADALYEFWAVPVAHHRRLYRCLRRLERKRVEIIPPIMRDSDRERLCANTIGFLKLARETLQKFHVPQKRGVLLLGEPGNGKTMACRWLYALAGQRGLMWRDVGPEDYAAAREGGRLSELFELDGPGIILFDDLDIALRDREETGGSFDLTTFLTEMDGLHPRQEVVYLFTSNAKFANLDAAFRRPGRIDLVLHFPRPNGELRQKFIEQHWHADIVEQLDIAHVVRVTEGLSFAEMEEVKRLLVLNFLETERWDWNAAWTVFRTGRLSGKTDRRIGFAAEQSRPLSANDIPCVPHTSAVISE